MPLVEPRRGIADPVVALTFDDGPSSWTLPIADHLERHGGRGTFFVIGEAVATDGGGAVVRRLLDRGHEVGNHTWTHPDLQTLDEPEVHEEMRRTSEALARVGVQTRVWRAPFFRCDDRVRAAVGNLAGSEVWFSSMPGDWELPAEETARRVLADLAPLDAHPAIGQGTGLSARSAAEQGADADPEILAGLARLNAAYEERHGFRFVVFVNRRPKAAILAVLEDRIENPTRVELETAVDELVAIAEDRWARA